MTYLLLQDNLRVDGREREDYRCLEVETDVISSAFGSARLRLVCYYTVEFILTFIKLTSL